MTSGPRRPVLPAIEASLRRFALEDIPALRRSHLGVVAGMLRAELRRRPALEVMFICTHNSRRSQMSQAWTTAIAHALGLQLTVSSGGTGPTGVHRSVSRALREHGFEVDETSPESCRWLVEFAPGAPPIELWSKRWDAAGNPRQNFVTIANCAAAEESCPTIPGALGRLAMLYEDPKVSDGTERELETYLSVCRQIGMEISWVLGEVLAPRPLASESGSRSASRR